jgi:(1->4)-alpha-D-glucan 1-alpha-D-glucosylmutase
MRGTGWRAAPARPARVQPAGRIPTATYRLQFHSGVGFTEALTLVPYLKELGISHLYASPLLKARPGSEHGYDVVDPTSLDPALGTDEEFDRLVEALHRSGMGLLLDIVPNHLAADSANPWWMDVLETGRASGYAPFFDINWLEPGRPAAAPGAPAAGAAPPPASGAPWPAGTRPPEGSRPAYFLLPLLGASLRTCLSDGSLALVLGEADPGEERGLAFFLEYYGQRFPLAVRSWKALLGLTGEPSATAEADPDLGGARAAGRRLAELLETAAPAAESTADHTADPAADPAVRAAAARKAKAGLAQLYESDPEVRKYVDRRLERLRTDVRKRRRSLLAAMRGVPYRLADARLASTALAYRRFFDVNGLVGVRVEDDAVFAETHRFVLELVADGKVDGLRIDHIDGLRDPGGYLARLRAALAEVGRGDLYVVVEKILAPGETLRPSWPLDGSTGYDFMGVASHVFVDRQGLASLEEAQSRIVGGRVDFSDLAYRSKKLVLGRLFQGEFRALVAQLAHVLTGLARPSAFGLDELAAALTELTCSLPVYRTYIRDDDPDPADVEMIRRAVDAAKQRDPASRDEALSYLGGILSLDRTHPVVAARPVESLELVLRWQQLTSPLAAKGVEDTALYRDIRLLSLDEVGSEPQMPEAAVRRFHERNRQVLARWPGTLNATSTHDAKRSEDVRARLDVLSEIPGEWRRRLEEWMTENERSRGSLRGAPVPDAAEEILIYQTLVGIWPPGGFPNDAAAKELSVRVEGYVTKALREAKIHSDWREPDEEYEGLVTGFVSALLTAGNSPFLAGIQSFARDVGWFGALGSLAQMLAKAVSPGVPDLYQGSELWQLSLTDPDNRRPVDFGARRNMLGQIGSAAPAPRDLLAGWEDGRIKLLVTARALALRLGESALFERGEYLVPAVEGGPKERLLVVGRRLEDSWTLAFIPRLTAGLLGFPGRSYPGGQVWGETAVTLPEEAPADWTDVLTLRPVAACGRRLPAGHVLDELPLALLTGRSNA